MSLLEIDTDTCLLKILMHFTNARSLENRYHCTGGSQDILVCVTLECVYLTALVGTIMLVSVLWYIASLHVWFKSHTDEYAT